MLVDLSNRWWRQCSRIHWKERRKTPLLDSLFQECLWPHCSL